MNKRAPYKVLLIGGTGTLSYAVLQMALGKGHNVTIFNRGKAHADLPKRVKAFKGDFYNVTSLEQVAILHWTRDWTKSSLIGEN